MTGDDNDPNLPGPNSLHDEFSTGNIPRSNVVHKSLGDPLKIEKTVPDESSKW